MISNTVGATLNYVWEVATLSWVKETQASGGSSSVTVINGLSIPAADYMTLTQASTTDTYVFKSGGSGGTTVATITITYTSSAKTTIQTVEKT